MGKGMVLFVLFVCAIGDQITGHVASHEDNSWPKFICIVGLNVFFKLYFVVMVVRNFQ